MKKLDASNLALLLLAVPALFAQSPELRDAEPGQEITTMQSPGLELRLKGPQDRSPANDPEGLLLLNPFPYGYHDVRPPLTPLGLAGVALSDTRILLRFEASSDNVRVLGYEIYRDGARVGSTETESYDDTGLLPMTSYGYQVVARDRSGNLSVPSALALATTLDSTTAGMPPQFLVAPYVRSASDTQAVIAFTVNKPVEARIDYGADTGYGSFQTVESSADYVICLTGLEPASLYHYRVVLEPAGAAVTSADRTFYTLAAADLTPPSFLQLPYVASVSSNTALLNWQTDEEAIGTVEYGAASPGELSAAEADYGIGHSLMVTGLATDTVYYFRVGITDRFGNGPAYSPEDAFVTLATADTTPPSLTTVPRALYLSSDRALVGWTTNEPADSRVWFGTASGSYDRMASSAAYAADHQVELLNLLADTVYYYVVRSQDASGNLSAASAERSFRTLRRADATPPRLSRIAVTPAERQALVTWRTDSPADSFAAYGDSSGVYPYQKLDSALLTQHELVLTGLEPDLDYYCQVASQDAAGNRTVSGEILFHTLPAGGAGLPVISGLSLSSTAVRIDFRWLTTTPTTTELHYRHEADAAWTLVEQTQRTTSHLVRLFPRRLLPGTYYYRVAGTDAYGQRVELSLDGSGQPLQFVVP